MADLTARERGRKAGLLRLAFATNPYRDHTQESLEWRRGWISATAELLREAPRPAGYTLALVHPHPAMTPSQVELVCDREGLELAHLGEARFALVQISGREPVTMLRIAPAPDFRGDRQRFPRGTEPEAA